MNPRQRQCAKCLTERRLVEIVVGALRRMKYPVATEIKHYEKRIDVVAIRPDTDELWAIEVKIAAWPRALRQAILNLTAVQRSYIAIYAPNIHRVSRSALDVQGIGLITVGSCWGEFAICKGAPLSRYSNALAITRVRQQVTAARRCRARRSPPELRRVVGVRR